MKDRLVKVLSNVKVATDTYKMELFAEDFPEKIVGGQFIHIALPDKTHPLRRPLCIADYDEINKIVTVVYAVVGDGTKILSTVEKGATLQALFPLGNGFSLGEDVKRVALVGGGLGSAVLPAIPTTWKDKEYFTFLGFGSADRAVLVEEMERCGKVYLATDDGSLGEKGFVTSLLRTKLDEIKPDVILCCGPEIMYKSLIEQTKGYNIPIFVSLERRMGCGVGACLVCNCKVRRADGETYLRACVDGPVFRLDEVVL